MNDPLRFLVIGCGGILKAHFPAFEKHPDTLKVAAVCDPVRAAAEKAAAAHPGAVVFDDPAKALDAMAGKIDAALVTTPHFLHFPHAAACLERGVPVLVEKPAACTADEVRRLQALEKGHGAFAQAGQMQRFGQEENWLKRWLQSAAFGEPRLFNLDIYQNIEGYVSDKPDAWILDKRTAGGGVAASVAVHILDLLRYWFEDDFTEVFAQGRFDPPMKGGAESTAVVVLKTRRGMLGTLNSSYTVARCPYSQRSLVFGTNGTLAQHLDKIGGGYAGPYYLASTGGKPSPEWNMMYSGWESVASRMEAEPGFARQTHPAAFVNQLLAFAGAVRAKRPGENSLARNFNTIATLDAIARGMASGKPEPVEAA